MSKQALVIEPDPLLRKIIASRLLAEYCNVDTASNVQEAEKILKTKPFDLVVTCLYLGTLRENIFAIKVKTLQPKATIVLVTDENAKIVALPFIEVTIRMPANAEELSDAFAKILRRK